MSVPVLLKQITKRFGDVIALENIDLEIAEGELFFLLGPSGCGKTTCLRIVAGFYQPDEGELYFGKRRMNDVPPHKRNTGMVFQNYALWPHMTVYENVAYGLDVRKVSASEKRRRVQQALEIVHMEEYAQRTPNQLSGGQQQRVALARALVIEPEVLLLDEPLSNLDAQLRLEMRQEIKRIHRETGITALYVTHDQKEALSLADRLAVMKDGRVIQVGSPREVYTHPVNRFVAGFIGETNFLEGHVVERESEQIGVKTPVGTVFSSQAEGFQIGEAITLSVRPESLVVSTEAVGALNELPAVVQRITYLGNVEELELSLSNGHEMKALHPNPGSRNLGSGSVVYLSFAASDVVPLRH